MSDTYKFAVVGNVSSVKLYQALGAETYAVSNNDDAREQTEKLFTAAKADENKSAVYAVVFVEEDFYKTFPEDLIEKFSRKALPAIIPVPSPKSGDDNFAGNRLRKIVERAVGSDILG
jgi:vacuolar-type H+-ATPase subunit F/Vma7